MRLFIVVDRYWYFSILAFTYFVQLYCYYAPTRPDRWSEISDGYFTKTVLSPYCIRPNTRSRTINYINIARSDAPQNRPTLMRSDWFMCCGFHYFFLFFFGFFFLSKSTTHARIWNMRSKWFRLISDDSSWLYFKCDMILTFAYYYKRQLIRKTVR